MTGRPSGPAADALVERIARHGPIGFDDFVDVALYHPAGGFYAHGGRAGRRGDFLTSPEVGPLFGAVVARALDRWWHEMGRPDPYAVIEVGAGAGTLARAVLAAAPACAPALRYVLVERSDALRAAHAEHLPLEPATGAFASPPAPEQGVIEAPTPSGIGPVCVSLAEPPAVRVTGVVLANELLDNLPPVLLERRPGGWHEVRVLVDGERFAEVVVPASPGDAALAASLAPDAADGARLPLQHRAAEWLRRSLGLLEAGRVVVVDYTSTSPELATRPWREWLRTYRGHGRGGEPLEEPGSRDVTCEVALDQLERVRRAARVSAQADFLAEHGMGELVEEGRRVWAERAHLGDLAAIRARSRVGEAEALADPGGLGAFQVVEWAVP